MEHLTEHLRTLGLPPDATLQEALSAHRDLIRVWHPDRFESDPKLKARAQEETVKINIAIAGVREAHRNGPQKPRAPLSSRRTTEHVHIALPTLIIHQPTRATVLQAIRGGAILYLGVFLVAHFSDRAAAQTALGVVLAGYGFSALLMALVILCFKTPILAINQVLLYILGSPAIPIYEVVGAHVLVSQRGTFLTVSCSPEYVRMLPITSRWLIRLRHLLRGYHFDFHDSLLDHHPAHVVQALSAITMSGTPGQAPCASAASWGTHVNTLATVCLTIAVVRCLGGTDYHLLSLVPYMILFALLRSAAILQTAVLAHPARHSSPH